MKSITIKDNKGNMILKIKKLKDGSYEKIVQKGLDVNILIVTHNNGRVMFNERPSMKDRQ